MSTDPMACEHGSTMPYKDDDFLSGRHITCPGPRVPEIVVLCGSTRFKEAFWDAGKRLAYEGKIVLTVSDLDPRPEARDVNVPIDAGLKARLDWLHKRKIDLADRVLVLNVGGYIGESTRSEIEYASAKGRPIDYLEPLSAAEVSR